MTKSSAASAAILLLALLASACSNSTQAPVATGSSAPAPDAALGDKTTNGHPGIGGAGSNAGGGY